MQVIAKLHSLTEDRDQFVFINTAEVVRDGSAYYADIVEAEINRLGSIGYSVDPATRIQIYKKDQEIKIPTLADGESWSGE